MSKNKSKSKKMTPDIDQKRTQMLNLTVLQRIDCHIEDILITAPHVSLYQFHYQWSRKDVEGPLFVVKRNTQPRFQFIVMNRRNTENLVEDLLGDFDFDIQVPYLLYSNASQEVNGIWFYNSHECEQVANLFTRILGAYSKVHKKPASSSKSNFDELGAVQTTAVIEGPQEPSLAGPGSAAVPVDSPFMNFFCTPINIGHSIDVFPSPLASQALYLNSAVTIGEDARGNLYQMLPENLKLLLRSKLKAKSMKVTSEKGYSILSSGWREALMEMLKWLVPVARDTVTWEEKKSFDKMKFDSKTSVLLMHTLHFADKDKAESAIAEVLVGLSFVFKCEDRRICAGDGSHCGDREAVLDGRCSFDGVCWS